MTTTNPRAIAGHNAPPPLDVILKDRYEPLAKQKKAWLKKAQAANLTPKTEEDIQALEKLFADGDTIVKDAEKARVVEKEIPLEATKTIDKFFNGGFRDEIGKLAGPIKTAALTRRAEMAEAEKKKAAEEAKKLADKAEEDARKAQAAAAAGNHKMAEVHAARADAKMNDAAAAQATANTDVRELSRSSVGGVSSTAGFKTVCTAVNKSEIDLEALRLVLKEQDLIDAVNKLIGMGMPAPKGAITERQVTGGIRAKR